MTFFHGTLLLNPIYSLYKKKPVTAILVTSYLVRLLRLYFIHTPTFLFYQLTHMGHTLLPKQIRLYT